jgi:MYXO-CTERM domain-containing protein
VAAAPQSYEGFAGVVVEPRTKAELETVLELADRVMSDRVGLGRFHILVGSDGKAALAATSIPHEIVVPDVASAIELERARIAARPVPADFGTWFEEFKTLDEINTYMDDLVELRPDLASVEDVGESWEGRTFRALRISGSGSDKPTIMTIGTQHAQEWMAAMISMCVADALVRDYDDDAEIHELLDTVEFIVAPVVNPDGYLFTWDENGDRYWRKNRNGAGVDLNRNWSFDFGVDEGSSGHATSSNYRGEEEFSEAETSSIRDFALAQARIDAHIDFHAFGQYVLFAYGCREPNAPNHDELETVATGMQEAIMGVHGEEYTVTKGADWYPACGVAPDWFYDEFDALAYTIELRPTDWDEGGGMSPPPDQSIPTCEEVRAGVLRLGAELTGGGSGTDTDTDTSGGGSTTSSATETGTGGTGTGAGTGTGSGTSDGGTGDDGTGGDGTGATDSDDDDPTATDTDGDSSSTEEGTGEGSANDEGCGCTTRGAGGMALAPLALVSAAVRRRRRAAAGG